MKHPSHRRASTVWQSQDGCTKAGKRTERANVGTASSDHHALPFIGLLRSIFGVEKIERLLAAVRFSFGDAFLRPPCGNRAPMRRFGLLLGLLFLQSLFIAIDYLPVTLEIVGHNHACPYPPVLQDRAKDASRLE